MRGAVLRVCVAVVAVGVLVGCGGSDDEAPTPGHGRGPFASATPSAPAPVVAPPTGRSRGSDLRTGGVIATGARVLPPTSTTTTTTETVEGTSVTVTERDLGAELAAAMGSPADCIDLETARSLHGHLSARVAATVMATGSITRASASGTGLSPAALACLQGRALGAHLASPIERAPRSVTASLTYDVTTTDDTVTVTTPDIPTPRGAVAPGIVTPAIGPSGPVSGSVAPDSTLPAQGPSGRPEGSVAPDIVLPARATP